MAVRASSIAQLTALRARASLEGYPTINMGIAVHPDIVGDLDRDAVASAIRKSVMRINGGADYHPDCTAMSNNWSSYAPGDRCIIDNAVHGVPLDFKDVLSGSIAMTPFVQGMGTNVTLFRTTGGEYVLGIENGYAPLARHQLVEAVRSGFNPDDPTLDEHRVRALSDVYYRAREANEMWARMVLANVMMDAFGWDGHFLGAQSVDERASLAGRQFIFARNKRGENYTVPFASLSESAQGLYLNGTFGEEEQEAARAGENVSLVVAGAPPLPNSVSPEEMRSYLSDTFSDATELGAPTSRAMPGADFSTESAAPNAWEIVNHTNAIDFAPNGSFEHRPRGLSSADLGKTPVFATRGHEVGVISTTASRHSVFVTPPLSANALAHNTAQFAERTDDADLEPFVLNECAEDRTHGIAEELNPEYIKSAAALVTGSWARDDPSLSLAAVVPPFDMESLMSSSTGTYYAQTHGKKVSAAVQPHPVDAPKALVVPLLVVSGAANGMLPANATTGIVTRHYGYTDYSHLGPLPGNKRVLFRAGPPGYHPDFDKQVVLVPYEDVVALRNVGRTSESVVAHRGLRTREIRRMQKKIASLEASGIDVATSRVPDAVYVRRLRARVAAGERGTDGQWHYGSCEGDASTVTEGFGSDTLELMGGMYSGSSVSYFGDSNSFTASDGPTLRSRMEQIASQAMSDAGIRDADSSDGTRVAKAAHAVARAQHRRARRSTKAGTASRARAAHHDIFKGAPLVAASGAYGQRRYAVVTPRERRILDRILYDDRVQRGQYNMHRGYNPGYDPLTALLLGGLLTARQVNVQRGRRSRGRRRRAYDRQRYPRLGGSGSGRRARATAAVRAFSSMAAVSPFSLSAEERIAELREAAASIDSTGTTAAAASARETHAWAAPSEMVHFGVDDPESTFGDMYGAAAKTTSAPATRGLEVGAAEPAAAPAAEPAVDMVADVFDTFAAPAESTPKAEPLPSSVAEDVFASFASPAKSTPKTEPLPSSVAQDAFASFASPAKSVPKAKTSAPLVAEDVFASFASPKKKPVAPVNTSAADVFANFGA